MEIACGLFKTLDHTEWFFYNTRILKSGVIQSRPSVEYLFGREQEYSPPVYTLVLNV
jgi:hypothetical protein